MFKRHKIRWILVGVVAIAVGAGFIFPRAEVIERGDYRWTVTYQKDGKVRAELHNWKRVDKDQFESVIDTLGLRDFSVHVFDVQYGKCRSGTCIRNVTVEPTYAAQMWSD
jgi:hypothetical protein